MAMTDQPGMLDGFLALSAALTGFPPFRLTGTGQAEPYLATAIGIVGEGNMRDLLAAFGKVVAAAGGDQAQLDRGLRIAVLSDDRLGPIARNLIKLWYVGTWYQMPRAWRDAHGMADQDRDFVVSPTAYTEGLLWPAIGANPAGAKPFGYGMWATRPRVALN